MSANELAREALALSVRDRVALAQQLWESLNSAIPSSDESAAIAEAVRRDEELSSGKIAGRSHDEVLRTARKELGCD